VLAFQRRHVVKNRVMTTMSSGSERQSNRSAALASSPIRQWPIVIVTQAGVRSSTRSCRYTGGTTIVVSMVLHTVDGGNRWGMVSSLL
jgi:hypothetical protein